MRGLLPVLLVPSLLGSACPEGGYALPEEDAVQIVVTEMQARGIEAIDRSHVISGVVACSGDAGCDPAVSFTLDGWDATRAIGFEVVSRGDSDFPPELGYDSIAGAARLQAAVDGRPGAMERILIFRQWYHENAFLCREQFTYHVRERLDALGLTAP